MLRPTASLVLLLPLLTHGLPGADAHEAPERPAPLLDGVLGETEWVRALVLELDEGAALLAQHEGGRLHLAVRAAQPSAVATLVLAKEDEAHVLHASHSLGTAKYRREPEGHWTRYEEFHFDPATGQADEAGAEARAMHLELHGWTATPAGIGRAGELELTLGPAALERFARVIETPDGPRRELRFALSLFDPGSQLVCATHPAGLDDGAVDPSLQAGDAPRELRLDPERWARLRWKRSAARDGR